MSHVIIPLTQNQITLVSPEDSDLANLKWYAFYDKKLDGYYAQRSLHPGHLFVHQVVLQRMLGRPLIKGELCDHINRDTLNNCQYNLRLASYSQNAQNRKLRSDNTSGYKGVSYHKTNRKWGANIAINGKQYHLGYYVTPELAYEAYCKAAIELHGEFARLD